jgi:pantoate--beta-alanine ligase
LQFLPNEDLDKYPNQIQKDIKICELLNVDYLFMPEKNSIYFDNENIIISSEIFSYKLEGRLRPKHFDGVLQIVLKLFNIIKPTNAYFGKKDAQQLLLIERLVRDYFLDINIIRCQTIRDSGGLAHSSRNIYLSDLEKQKAYTLPRALKNAMIVISKDIVDVQTVIDNIKKELSEICIEYIEIVDMGFSRIKKIEKSNTIIVCAVRIGDVRLIDNVWI